MTKEKLPKSNYCFWLDLNDPLYVRYHDQEWGHLRNNDDELFEALTLEILQGGLSFKTILHKRQALKKAFRQFHITKVAAFDETIIACFSKDPTLIRNHKKIAAIVNNAKAMIALQKTYGSFDAYIKSFIPKIIYETHEEHLPLAKQISQDLKNKGFTYIGPKTIYAFLQAVGFINSHERGCHLYAGKQ